MIKINDINSQNSNKNSNITGFTLIEVLIAITIFAILTTGCYHLITSVTKTHIIVSKTSNGLLQIQKGQRIIQKDLTQLIARPIRSAKGEQEYAVYSSFSQTDQTPIITFTRAGYYNLINQTNSDLLRVSYHFENNQIVRYSWQTLDQAIQEDPIKQIILNNVESLNIKFLNKQNQWTDKWPPVTDAQQDRLIELPHAIQIDLSAEFIENIQWLFPGVKAPPEKIKVDLKKSKKETEKNETQEDDDIFIDPETEDEDDEGE